MNINNLTKKELIKLLNTIVEFYFAKFDGCMDGGKNSEYGCLMCSEYKKCKKGFIKRRYEETTNDK